MRLLGFWFWIANLACRATKEIRCCLGDPETGAMAEGTVWGLETEEALVEATGRGAVMGRGDAVIRRPAAVFRAGVFTRVVVAPIVVTDLVSLG